MGYSVEVKGSENLVSFFRGDPDSARAAPAVFDVIRSGGHCQDLIVHRVCHFFALSVKVDVDKQYTIALDYLSRLFFIDSAYSTKSFSTADNPFFL